MFEPVELKWKGRAVVIPSGQVLGAIAVAEEHLTLGHIAKLRENPQTARVSQAYASVLRYAGVEVDDAEVYEAFCDPATGAAEITADIAALVHMMIPRNLLSEQDAGNVRPGKSRQSKTKRRVNSSKSDIKHL